MKNLVAMFTLMLVLISGVRAAENAPVVAVTPTVPPEGKYEYSVPQGYEYQSPAVPAYSSGTSYSEFVSVPPSLREKFQILRETLEFIKDSEDLTKEEKAELRSECLKALKALIKMVPTEGSPPKK